MRGCRKAVLCPPYSQNLVLDEFDRELTRRGLRFCRYADDCNIYVGSRRAGERVMASVCRFLTTRLQLKVNESKSAVARSGERKFLGFTISNEAEPTRHIAAKALQKFKDRIRELTRRTLGVSLPQLIVPLARYLIGWRGYFGFCQTPIVLQEPRLLDTSPIAHHIWRQWKNGRLGRELRRLGVSHFHAAIAAGGPDLAHGSACDGAAGPIQRLLRLDRPSSVGGPLTA